MDALASNDSQHSLSLSETLFSSSSPHHTLPLHCLLSVGHHEDPGEPGVLPLLEHGEVGLTILVVPDDADPGAQLPLLELILEKTSESEVRHLLVIPGQSILVQVLDVAEYLTNLN